MAIDCAAIGDSIAVGTGRAARCAVYARESIPSATILKNYSVNADFCVISAGSNDPNNPRLKQNLQGIRARQKCGRVVWLLPVHPRAARIVRAVAAMHGDMALGFVPGPDRVHPKSYRAVARDLGRK
jgi:hypothetical protein